MSDDLGVLDRYLTVWIGLAMILGVALGHFIPGIADMLNAVTWHGTSLSIAIGLFVMIFPIMAEIDYERIPRVTRTARREIALTLTFNWLIAPFVMYGLAVFFLSDYPEFVTGLIIVGIAPCIAMVLVWNELASGNQEMCAVCVGVNSFLQILLFVLYAFLFLTVLRETTVSVDIALIAQMVGVFLGLPLLIGFLTQKIAFRTVGERAYYERVIPRISPFGLLGLLFTVVVMFALKGEYIVSHPEQSVLIATPLFIFFAAMWGLAYGRVPCSALATPKESAWRSQLRRTISNWQLPSQSPSSVSEATSHSRLLSGHSWKSPSCLHSFGLHWRRRRTSFPEPQEPAMLATQIEMGYCLLLPIWRGQTGPCERQSSWKVTLEQQRRTRRITSSPRNRIRPL